MTDDAAPAGQPDDPTPPSTDQSSNGLFELIAAIVLGIAATLTAFSAYKAALADGDALQGYTKSTRILSDANAFYAQGNQTFSQDQQLFVSYAAATKTDADLAEYLTTLMRPELSKAVEWWKGNDDAVTPFDDDKSNPYTNEDIDQAAELETEAGKVFDTAADADDNGDQYELSTVLLAITLFFAGIATLFRRRPAKLVLMGVAIATMIAGGVGVALALSAG